MADVRSSATREAAAAATAAAAEAEEEEEEEAEVTQKVDDVRWSKAAEMEGASSGLRGSDFGD